MGPRGQADAAQALFAGFCFLRLCLRRKLSPFISRIWTWWVRRSSNAPVRRSEPKTSVHSSNGRLEVTRIEPPVSLRHRLSRVSGRPRDCGCAPQRASPWPDCLRASRPRSQLLRDLERRIKVLPIQTAMLPGCDMTSKKTLNTRNLEALGAERLAELLIEICKGRPAARRLLRLELAGALGTAELAREVRHRMATIRRSRAVIDSRRRRDLVDGRRRSRSGSARRQRRSSLG